MGFKGSMEIEIPEDPKISTMCARYGGTLEGMEGALKRFNPAMRQVPHACDIKRDYFLQVYHPEAYFMVLARNIRPLPLNPVIENIHLVLVSNDRGLNARVCVEFERKTGIVLRASEPSIKRSVEEDFLTYIQYLHEDIDPRCAALVFF